MTQSPRNNSLYFQMFGLTATAPEKLNASMRRAIESLHQTLYASSSGDLSERELLLLEEGGMDATAHSGNDDPMLAYATEFAAILETSLNAAAVAKRLGGITPVRVRQMIRGGALLATQVDNRWHIPSFQFEKNRLVPNISRINEAMPRTLDTVSALRWYTTPDAELEIPDGEAVSPLDWIKAGLDPAVPIRLVQDL